MLFGSAPRDINLELDCKVPLSRNRTDLKGGKTKVLVRFRRRAFVMALFLDTPSPLKKKADFCQDIYFTLGVYLKG